MSKEMPKNHREFWTDEEMEYLTTSWGYVSVERIAIHLQRTKKAIREKANSMKLGRQCNADGGMSALELGRILGTPGSSTVSGWIRNNGLKARKINFIEFKQRKHVYIVYINDFWKWAKDNQDKIDTNRFKEGDLGTEPSWMKEKRKHDKENKHPEKRMLHWTEEEERLLFRLYFGTSNTYEELSARFGRTPHSLKRKLDRISEKLRERYSKGMMRANKELYDDFANIPPKDWTVEEVMVVTNCISHTKIPVRGIAYMLGRSYKSVAERVKILRKGENANKNWTTEEMKMLVQMHQSGKFTAKEMAVLLGRSLNSVNGKLKNLKKEKTYQELAKKIS